MPRRIKAALNAMLRLPQVLYHDLMVVLISPSPKALLISAPA